ncbi:acid protease, partial [Dendrothele bispora CBS 962.96]
SFVSASPVPEMLASSGLKARKIPGGYSIPFKRTKSNLGRRDAGGMRRAVSGESGLGDSSDFIYTIPVEIGGVVTAPQLDTGSSDLWVISDACTASSCNVAATETRYTMSTFNESGSSFTIRYGDGSGAFGPIGFDTTTVAGIAIQNQAFGAVNTTDAGSGVFGLGFPSVSQIQKAIIQDRTGWSSETDSDDFVTGTYQYGPLLARVAMTNALEMPMFAVELQRATIDVDGQDGILTVGTLPEGVDNSSLTWVPVRLYKPDEGGLRAPSFAPDEVYPLNWEIDIDGVFLDGERIADSSIPPNGVNPSGISALVDTGNSLLRGPYDVVDDILSSVANYDPVTNLAILPCDVPHTLAFQIGGKMFPVDPRDFIGEPSEDALTCVANKLVASDPPHLTSLFRWSLGDPFMKSNLVAFYYGNLTHPSVDPPRIGFLSTVPSNADILLEQAVADAKANGGTFDSTSVAAPTASAATATKITVSFGAASATQTSLAAGAASTDSNDGSSGS